MFLLAAAGLLYFLGIILFFKRSMILISNVDQFVFQILFILGLYFFIGITGIVKFFTKKGKIKGSAVYFGGLITIVLGWSFIGAVLQILGFLMIFRTFLPDFYDYICRVPVIGRYLSKKSIQNRKLCNSERFRQASWQLELSNMIMYANINLYIQFWNVV